MVGNKIEMVDITRVVPYVNNPRFNDDAVDQVKRSIEEYGFKNPIIVDKNLVIIAGHTRLKAAKKIGMEQVPVIIADDLSDKQVKAFRIADNKVGEIAEWDDDLLHEELLELEGLFTGFDFNMFDEEDEVEEDDYEVEIPEKPKSKKGDIYQLGDHKVMCGSSTESEDVNQLMVDEKADLFLTDPPYNVEYIGKTKDTLTIENDAMDDGNFRQLLVDAFSNADNVMREGASFYIWHADSEGYNFRGACRDVNWQVRQCLIWNKNTLVMGRQDYHWKHEPCLYGWKPGGPHFWNSDRKQVTVLDFDRPQRNAEHPTMKPVLLFDYQIKNNTKKGDLVYDAFGGSGTTIIACEENGRRANLMELDPRYVDVIINRWEELTGNKAILIKKGEK